MGSWTRRQFLKRTLGGAGVLVTLPYLEAFGASPAAPLRFLPIMVPNGIIMDRWTPAADGPLASLPATLSPLQGRLSQLCVISGLVDASANPGQDGGGDHARASATFLTGRRAKKSETEINVGASVDQIIAKAIGATHRHPSLQICADTVLLQDLGYSLIYSTTVSYADAVTPQFAETSPRRLFDQVFGGLDADSSMQERQKQLRNRKSVLDYVLGEANTLRTALGRPDRHRLDEFMQSVREVERRLDAQGAGHDNDPACPVGTSPIPEQTDYPERLKLFSDLVALAFQCQLTRVISFMFAAEGSLRSYPFIGIPDAHHSLTHHDGDSAKIDKVAKIDRFHVESLHYLLGRLTAVKEGERTLLENTVVLYGSAISDGNVHAHDNLPILLAGAGSALFRPGAHLRFPGRPLADLQLRIAQAMGVTLGQFGDSTGPLI